MPDIPIYRRDFKALADLRAEEARILLAKGKRQGAYYLAGYAVECALKACIAKKTKRFEFPPKADHVRKLYRHGLNELLNLAGLDVQLRKDMAVNKAFEANWSTVKDWTAESRYRTSGLNGKDMYNAVTGADGVLAWIKLRW
jgi:HEPN domain-containing protein